MAGFVGPNIEWSVGEWCQHDAGDILVDDIDDAVDLSARNQRESLEWETETDFRHMLSEAHPDLLRRLSPCPTSWATDCGTRSIRECASIDESIHGSVPGYLVDHVAQPLASREATRVFEKHLVATFGQVLGVLHRDMRGQQHIG